jgi:hypothetical protein
MQPRMYKKGWNVPGSPFRWNGLERLERFPRNPLPRNGFLQKRSGNGVPSLSLGEREAERKGRNDAFPRATFRALPEGSEKTMHIDPDKLPDAPRHDVTYAGMPLISRYGKRRELETMMAAIDWIIDRNPGVARLIVELFCDSQASACYSAACCHADGPCSPDEAQAVADALDHAFRAVDGGHNGIAIEAHDGGQLYVDPWWNE